MIEAQDRRNEALRALIEWRLAHGMPPRRKLPRHDLYWRIAGDFVRECRARLASFISPYDE